MAEITDHYTAHVSIVKVSKVEQPGINTRSVSAPKSIREKREELNLTVRSSTLAGLQQKIRGHIDLIDETDIGTDLDDLDEL